MLPHKTQLLSSLQMHHHNFPFTIGILLPLLCSLVLFRIIFSSLNFLHNCTPDAHLFLLRSLYFLTHYHVLQHHQTCIITFINCYLANHHYTMLFFLLLLFLSFSLQIQVLETFSFSHFSKLVATQNGGMLVN